MVEQAQGLEELGAQQRVQSWGLRRVQEVPRAQQQVLERGARPAREHHGTPPPLVLRQLPPLVLGLLPLLLLSLLLLLLLVLLLLVLLLQAALRHFPRVSVKKKFSLPPHKHHKHHKNQQHLHKSASLGVSFCGGGLPSFLPRPLPPFLPLLPGALHFLRAARTLNFNLMWEARGQWPPATGFSPGGLESTFYI